MNKETVERRSCYMLPRCVDASVGPEPLPDSQPENLRQLKELLNAEVDRIGIDRPDRPDDTLELRMRVKEFMAILHSKWSTTWSICSLTRFCVSSNC